jgi:septum formation protein
MIILVSKSPRRKEILKKTGYTFETISADIDETEPLGTEIERIPEYLAEKKVNAVADNYPDNLLIGADTIVVLENEILGKPENDVEAIEILKKLSGKVHQVISGCTIVFQEKQITFNDITKVYFRELSDDEIAYYVENFQPFDKAGAYGIQEWIGMVGIEKIEGSFYNVMGLPIHKVYKAIQMITGQES